MILGTYWYFAFPTGLYKFDYFEFSQGYGGRADIQAELITSIETEQPDKIISELKELIERYNEGFMFIQHDKNKLTIGTGGYQLFDYDFLLMKEVEKVLKMEKVKLANNQKLDNPTLLRLVGDNYTGKIIFPKKGFLQIVGSELKKQNAENTKLRLDCHLKLKDKDNFIAASKAISIEEGIEIFFYYDKEFEDVTNLMLLFANGRQGLNLKKRKFIDVVSFENKLEEAMLRHNALSGHAGGFEYYPKNGPKIEMIIEEEYII